MKTIALIFMLCSLSSFANTGLIDMAKDFGSVVFSSDNQAINVDSQHVQVHFKSAINDIIQVASISYTDASDHYYATIEMQKDSQGLYFISSCTTPDYVVEWKNGEACRDI